MAIFGYSKFIPVFLAKVVGKNLEWLFLAILNSYQSFWGKFSEKIQNGQFWPFKFIPVFLGKLSEKFRMAIFGHSKSIPIFLGKNCQKKFGIAIFGHSEFFSDNFTVHITLIEEGIGKGMKFEHFWIFTVKFT